jgi:hypothetical protein
LYIVPRKDAYYCWWYLSKEKVKTEITEPSTIQRILNNGIEVFPALKQQQVIGSWAGLRPYRPEVRVEQEKSNKYYSQLRARREWFYFIIWLRGRSCEDC